MGAFETIIKWIIGIVLTIVIGVPIIVLSKTKNKTLRKGSIAILVSIAAIIIALFGRLTYLRFYPSKRTALKKVVPQLNPQSVQ